MSENLGNRLNILRAGVLGANDGIISTAGLIIGVAGATTSTSTILISGIAGLVAGALSMAGGEYVSVSAQRDTEKAAIAKEKQEIKTDYPGEVKELESIYQDRGLSAPLAKEVATELMQKDALAAHASAELHIDLHHLSNPYSAAFSSFCAFTVGALLPLLCMLLLSPNTRVAGTFMIVMLSLALTGFISAKLGGAPTRQAVIRNVFVGMMTMLITYGIGILISHY